MLALERRCAKVGLGMIARNTCGDLVGAALQPVKGMISTFCAQLLTLVLTVKFNVERNWMKICFEFDCFQVINLINQ